MAFDDAAMRSTSPPPPPPTTRRRAHTHIDTHWALLPLFINKTKNEVMIVIVKYKFSFGREMADTVI